MWRSRLLRTSSAVSWAAQLKYPLRSPLTRIHFATTRAVRDSPVTLSAMSRGHATHSSIVSTPSPTVLPAKRQAIPDVAVPTLTQDLPITSMDDHKVTIEWGTLNWTRLWVEFSLEIYLTSCPSSQSQYLAEGPLSLSLLLPPDDKATSRQYL